MRDLQSGNNRGKAGGNFERNNAANIGSSYCLFWHRVALRKRSCNEIIAGKREYGYCFVRTDLPGHPEIQALAENVSSTVKATTVSENGTEVFTVEHLMAAFSMMGIDNCRIEMSAPEPPVTDGSAAVFCELILQAGRIRQSEPRKIYAVDRAFSVYEDDKYITIQPYDGYRISFVSVNAHPALGTQYFDIELTEEKFLQEIAAARTVGFMSEIKQMQQMGLGLGGSIENVVILMMIKFYQRQDLIMN